MECCRQGLEQFPDTLSGKAPREFALQWAQKLTKELEDQFKTAEAVNPDPSMSNNAWMAVQAFLGKHFVVSVADKSPQTMVGMCMKEYVRKLRAAMTNPVRFRKITEKEALAKVKGFQDMEKMLDIPASPITFPYLYLMPKLHKPGELVRETASSQYSLE
jgi:hypothetical protein